MECSGGGLCVTQGQGPPRHEAPCSERNAGGWVAGWVGGARSTWVLGCGSAIADFNRTQQLLAVVFYYSVRLKPSRHSAAQTPKPKARPTQSQIMMVQRPGPPVKALFRVNSVLVSTYCR
jgi:hypothetical protein